MKTSRSLDVGYSSITPRGLQEQTSCNALKYSWKNIELWGNMGDMNCKRLNKEQN